MNPDPPVTNTVLMDGILEMRCACCRNFLSSHTESPTMSLIDKALEANRSYAAKTHDPTRAQRPAPKIAVVVCMDPRMSDYSRQF